MTVRTKLVDKDPVLLEEFRIQFELLSGNPVELSYLEASTVRGFFKKDSLVAGYVLNKQSPHRLLMWIPENVRQQMIERYIPGGPHSCCELTCMWKDRSTVSHWETNWVYMVAIYDGVFSGKQNILGGSFISKLATGQTRILDNVVYSGPSEFKNGAHCIVYYATRYGALWGILREITVEIRAFAGQVGKSVSNSLTQ